MIHEMKIPQTKAMLKFKKYDNGGLNLWYDIGNKHLEANIDHPDKCVIIYVLTF